MQSHWHKCHCKNSFKSPACTYIYTIQNDIEQKKRSIPCHIMEARELRRSPEVLPQFTRPWTGKKGIASSPAETEHHKIIP